MKKAVRAFTLFLVCILSFGMFCTQNVFATDLRLTINPAIVSLDLTNKQTGEFELSLAQTADISTVDVEIKVEYIQEKIQSGSTEQPLVTFDGIKDKVTLKQNKITKIKGKIQMPKNVQNKEYEIDIIFTTTSKDKSLKGSLRVPIFIKNNIKAEKKIVYKGTTVKDKYSEFKGDVYKDYKEIIKDIAKFNWTAVKQKWVEIKTKNYIYTDKNDKKKMYADLKYTDYIPLRKLVVTKREDVTPSSYIIIENQPVDDDVLTAITIDESSAKFKVASTGDKEYILTFIDTNSAIFKSKLTELNERLKGNVKYSDILDLVTLPSSLYSNSLTINTLLKNEGEVSATENLTYSIDLKDSAKNLKNSVLIAKGTDKIVTTGLTFTKQEIESFNKYYANITLGNNKITDSIKIIPVNIRFKPLIYIIIGIVLILNTLIILVAVLKKHRKRHAIDNK